MPVLLAWCLECQVKLWFLEKMFFPFCSFWKSWNGCLRSWLCCAQLLRKVTKQILFITLLMCLLCQPVWRVWFNIGGWSQYVKLFTTSLDKKGFSCRKTFCLFPTFVFCAIELYTPVFVVLLNFVADVHHSVIAMYLLMFCFIGFFVIDFFVIMTSWYLIFMPAFEI